MNDNNTGKSIKPKKVDDSTRNSDPVVSTNIRVVFNWESKVIRVDFCFALLCSVIGWQNSRYFLSQLEANPKPSATCTRTLSRPWSRLQLLQFLIGSMGRLCLLWLVRANAMVWVLRNAIENHSKQNAIRLCSSGPQRKQSTTTMHMVTRHQSTSSPDKIEVKLKWPHRW